MRSLLIRTFLIQSIGVVSLLAATLLVARLGGPRVQSDFAIYKAINDFQVTFLSFGLPTAIVYVLNKTGSGEAALFRYANLYAIILCVPLSLFDMVLLGFFFPERDVLSSMVADAVFIGTASSALVGYSFIRSILLTKTDGNLFSFVTILPSVLLLVSVPPSLWLGMAPIPLAYFFMGGASVFVSILLTRPRLQLTGSFNIKLIEWRPIFSQASHIFLQSLLFGLQPLITIFLLRKAGVAHDVIGYFHLASLVHVLANLLVAMVAPVLLNRWSKGLDRSGLSGVAKSAAWIALAIQCLAMVLIPFAAPATMSVFGQAFSPVVTPAIILIFSIGALIFSRIMIPALLGLGYSWVLTWSNVFRLAVISLVGFSLSGSSLDPLIWAAISWVAGEYAALGLLLFFMVKIVSGRLGEV